MVTTRPELTSVIELILKAIDGVHVYRRTEGRILATLGGWQGTQYLDAINDLGAIRGVISASLVYH